MDEKGLKGTRVH